MKDKLIRFVCAPGKNRRRHLLPLFLAAAIIGILIHLSIYKKFNTAGIRQQEVGLQTKWNQITFAKRLEDSKTVNIGGSSDKQPGNETVIMEESQKNSASITINRQLEMWEEPTLLNINFTWLSNNEAICKLNANDPKDLRIMPILVHTSRSHFRERLSIRKSWGSVPIYRNWDVRFVFLLGEADRGFEKQEKRLKEEQDEFGDLVIGSFTDTYYNLTYKHLMGYKWILNFCRDAALVMKVDDDMFIDILRWLDWRSDDLDIIAKNNSAKIPDLYCHTFGGTGPVRDIGSKWYASVEDWPDGKYPDYCSGWAYALTVDVIQKIYLSSNDRKMFRIDDVFVTGALMEVAKKKFDFKPGYKHIWGEVTTDIREYRPMCEEGSFEDKRQFRAVSYVPRDPTFERDMMCMWNKTLYDRNITYITSIV